MGLVPDSHLFQEPPAPDKVRETVERTNTAMLRDKFAMSALEGMLANSGYHIDGVDDAEHFATLAYQYADAMLKERNR